MDLREIEDLIKNLKGVLNCKITTDDMQIIREVHIVADESRGAKQISRDIQSILVAVYGVELDYKKISIAQVKGAVYEQPERRLRIKAIERYSMQSKYHVKIVLEKDGDEFTGECTGMNNAALCLRRTGEAALLAVEKFLGEDGILSLDDIKVIDLTNIRMVAVAMTAYTEERGVEFCGCAILGHDNFDCVVRAVLDAINPLVERYMDD